MIKISEEIIKHVMENYGVGRENAEEYVSGIFKYLDSIPGKKSPLSEEEKAAIVIGGTTAAAKKLGLNYATRDFTIGNEPSKDSNGKIYEDGWSVNVASFIPYFDKVRVMVNANNPEYKKKRELLTQNALSLYQEMKLFENEVHSLKGEIYSWEKEAGSISTNTKSIEELERHIKKLAEDYNVTGKINKEEYEKSKLSLSELQAYKDDLLTKLTNFQKHGKNIQSDVKRVKGLNEELENHRRETQGLHGEVESLLNQKVNDEKVFVKCLNAAVTERVSDALGYGLSKESKPEVIDFLLDFVDTDSPEPAY